MPELVALDLPPGTEFVDTMRRLWDEGHAVLPVDQRLPHDAKLDLVTRLAATSVLSHSGSDRRPGRPTEPGDAVVVATSGTTGHPKGAVLTHDALQASATITSQAIGASADDDTWLACLPLAHIGGLSVVTRALYTGTGLVVHERFDVEACERAAHEGATLVSLVVTALGRINAGLFRKILVGGSAIPAERPANTVATYGMTETGSGIVYDGWPLPGVELRVAAGEIQVRSPTLLRCYRDGTVPFEAGGWYRTGDAGHLDEAGKLSVQGRIGDVIVTGGEKVWPAAVERALLELPWVTEAAAIGRPDPEWGHSVTAVIVVEPGHQAPPIEALREQLADLLPRYALPRSIEVVASLPRTSVGKVERKSL